MAEKLYTLTEVSKSTGISMPTLQRYKKLYQDRIPSQGAGRTQRYPKEALSIFRELKKENIGRRGRPRKNPAAPAKAKPVARKAAKRGKAKSAPKAQEGLLTLTQVGKLTGISYPTLLRYVSMHLKKLPHKGTGRARRFLPEAVDVFKSIREESRRGRAPKAKTKAKAKAKAAPKKAAKKATKAKRATRVAKAAAPDAALAGRIQSLEKMVKSLEKQLVRVEKLARKPVRITLQR